MAEDWHYKSSALLVMPLSQPGGADIQLTKGIWNAEASHKLKPLLCLMTTRHVID